MKFDSAAGHTAGQSVPELTNVEAPRGGKSHKFDSAAGHVAKFDTVLPTMQAGNLSPVVEVDRGKPVKFSTPNSNT